MGSTYKQDILIPELLTVPTLDYYRRDPKPDGSINLTHGEQVHINGKHYNVFGLFGSYLEINENPIQSYECAVKNKHNIAELSCTSIVVEGNQGNTKIIVIQMDDIVYIEGRAYKLSPAPNENIYLTETTEIVDYKYV